MREIRDFLFEKAVEGMTAEEVLNYYRNLYHGEPQSTERGIVANALNDILSRMILPPCKVGDTVYRISKRYGEWCVLPRTVCSIRYSLDSRGNIAWYLFTTIEDRIGKTVFLTREEAERALKAVSDG